MFQQDAQLPNPQMSNKDLAVSKFKLIFFYVTFLNIKYILGTLA